MQRKVGIPGAWFLLVLLTARTDAAAPPTPDPRTPATDTSISEALDAAAEALKSDPVRALRSLQRALDAPNHLVLREGQKTGSHDTAKAILTRSGKAGIDLYEATYGGAAKALRDAGRIPNIVVNGSFLFKAPPPLVEAYARFPLTRAGWLAGHEIADHYAGLGRWDYALGIYRDLAGSAPLVMREDKDKRIVDALGRRIDHMTKRLAAMPPARASEERVWDLVDRASFAPAHVATEAKAELEKAAGRSLRDLHATLKGSKAPEDIARSERLEALYRENGWPRQCLSYADGIKTAFLLPDGKLGVVGYAASDDGQKFLDVIDPLTLQVTRRIERAEGHKITSFHPLPKANRVVAVEYDAKHNYRLSFYDPSTGERKTTAKLLTSDDEFLLLHKIFRGKRQLLVLASQRNPLRGRSRYVSLEIVDPLTGKTEEKITLDASKTDNLLRMGEITGQGILGFDEDRKIRYRLPLGKDWEDRIEAPEKDTCFLQSTLSPDHSLLAYIESSAWRPVLVVSDAESLKRKKIIPLERYPEHGSLGLRGDNGAVAYVIDDKLHVHDVATGTLIQEPVPARGLTEHAGFTADGKSVILRNSKHLCLFPVSAKGSPPEKILPAVGRGLGPDWQPPRPKGPAAGAPEHKDAK